MSAVLVVVLVCQFRLRRYVPLVYWLAVVLLSIVGTLITDNLTDKYNVALATTTTIFAITLALVFLAWYLSERTLSIHTIFTTRREAFYWLAILFTFAFGTAAGDYLAETLNLGYWKSAFLFGGAIALITFAWRYLHLNAVLAFWLAYILTRPLGASLGDYLSQPKADGGLGLGTNTTTFIFLAAILAVVVYLTITNATRHRPTRSRSKAPLDDEPRAQPGSEGDPRLAQPLRRDRPHADHLRRDRAALRLLPARRLADVHGRPARQPGLVEPGPRARGLLRGRGDRRPGRVHHR